MRAIDVAENDQDEAILSIQDGRREAKASVFKTHIDLFDQNERRGTYRSSPSSFHVYRLAVLGDAAWLYVDGALAADGRLIHRVPRHAILFGNYSRTVGSTGLTAEIDYLAYSAEGAFAPDGTRLAVTR